MKDEEFNDLLQFHAESFELKPSSGSFDSVMRKYGRQKQHKLVVRLLPMAAAIAALPVAWFVFREAPKVPAGTTAHSMETPAPAVAEGTSPGATADNYDVPQDNNPQAADNTGSNSTQGTNETTGPVNHTGNTVIPPSKESKALVAGSPVYTPVKQGADTTRTDEAPALRGVPGPKENNPVVVTEVPDEKIITDEQPVAEKVIEEPKPALATVTDEKDKKQQQAIRPEDPRDKRCNHSRFALSAFITPFVGGMFSAGSVPVQATEQKTAYNIGGQPVSYALGNEKPLASMAAGVKATFAVAAGWSVSAGVTYTSLRMRRSVFTLVTERDPAYTIANVNNNQVTSHETRRKIAEDKYNVTYGYITVPVQVAYSFKHNRWGIDLTAGTSFNLLHKVIDNPKSNADNNVAISTLKTPFDYRNITVGVNAGSYVSYSLNNCTSVYAGPQVSSGVQSIYRASAEKPTTVPVTVGLETGIKIYF